MASNMDNYFFDGFVFLFLLLILYKILKHNTIKSTKDTDSSMLPAFSNSTYEYMEKSDPEFYIEPKDLYFILGKIFEHKNAELKGLVLWPDSQGISTVIISNGSTDHRAIAKMFDVNHNHIMIALTWNAYDLAHPIDGGYSISAIVSKRSELKLAQFLEKFGILLVTQLSRR